MRSFLLLVLALALGGCSLWPFSGPSTKKTAFTLWPFKSGRADATAFLEYQRSRSEDKEDEFAFVVRNTHEKRWVDGEIRATFETARHATSVRIEHFSLGPNGAKEVFVYPTGARLSYEVTAFFKE